MMTAKVKTKPGKTKPIKTAVEKYVFRLYIAGQTPNAITALKNLRIICEEKLKGKYHIHVIDLLKFPFLGRKDQIFAIPTLMRKQPLPVRLIIGDLSDTDCLLAGLNLKRLN
jgi:circadian clock protein KaiB